MDKSLAWLCDPELIGGARMNGARTDSAQNDGVQSGGVRAAAMVASLLARNSGPATLLFEELAREPVRIEMTDRADRRLRIAECLELHVDRGTTGIERTGTLRAMGSGLAIAEVSSLVVPSRLPAPALRTLGIPSAQDPAPPPSEVPLGKVLAGLGVRREPRGVRLVRGDDPEPLDGPVFVEASARMWLGDVPVAVASERVTAAFCQRAASHLATCPSRDSRLLTALR